MRKLNRVELLRNINHSLRSPLNSVLNLADMMILGIDGDLSPSAYDSILEIREDMARLDKNIMAILEMIDLITAPLETKKLQITSPLHRAVNAFQSQTARNEVRINIAANDVYVDADEEALYQVFQCLISHFEQTVENEIHAEVNHGGNDVSVTIGVKLAPISSIGWLKDELSIGVMLCKQLIEQQGGSLYLNEELEPPAFKIILPRSIS